MTSDIRADRPAGTLLRYLMLRQRLLIREVNEIRASLGLRPVKVDDAPATDPPPQPSPAAGSKLGGAG